MICGDSSPAHRSRPQAGYALLFAIFLSATLFLLAFAAGPSIINQGRREREQQLIWRGNQYLRGIRLYFQKNGRLPQNKDELTKGTLNVHFVRKAFTDPVNTAGNDWRMIYVAPSGQLTGSVRYRSLQEMAAALSGNASNSGSLGALFGAPAGAPAGAGAGRGAAPQAGPAGAGRGAGRGAGAGARGGVQGGPTTPGAAAGAPSAAGARPLGGMGQLSTPAPLGAVDGPVLGASMIGIASKVKRPSLLVYQGKGSYFDWEFIWNPLLARGAGGATPGAQQPAAAQPAGGAVPSESTPAEAIQDQAAPTSQPTEEPTEEPTAPEP